MEKRDEVLEVRCVVDSAREATDMDRRGVSSCPSFSPFRVEVGRLILENASGSARLFSVEARGVEKMSTGCSWCEGGIEDVGDEVAESSRGSRAYSSLKTFGFGIRTAIARGKESLGDGADVWRGSEAIFPWPPCTRSNASNGGCSSRHLEMGGLMGTRACRSEHQETSRAMGVVGEGREDWTAVSSWELGGCECFERALTKHLAGGNLTA